MNANALDPAVAADPVAAPEPAVSIAGQSLLIVGGDRREHHIKRLYHELNVAHVFWCSTRESDASSDRFEHLIRRGQFDIVVALWGLMRHQHFKSLRRLCSECGIRLVVLHRSPSPARVLRAVDAIIEIPVLTSRA